MVHKHRYLHKVPASSSRNVAFGWRPKSANGWLFDDRPDVQGYLISRFMLVRLFGGQPPTADGCRQRALLGKVEG